MRRGLIVHFPAMGNAGDVYGGGVIIDGVDNAIIPNADAPLLHAADQFLASGRTRVGGEASMRATIRAITAAGSRFNSFSALAANASRYALATKLAAFDQVSLDLFKRDALFMPARLRHKHIFDFLPKLLVFLQVDDGRRLPPFFVGQKLNSGHGVSVPSRHVFIVPQA